MSTKNNPHIGSTFESWLDEQGIREEVTAAAVKSVIAEQIAAAMKERGLTKSRMAELMHTSRAHGRARVAPRTSLNRAALFDDLRLCAGFDGRAERRRAGEPASRRRS